MLQDTQACGKPLNFCCRPPTEKEAEVVVSKEVKKMRDYEQALLRAYQALLKALLEVSHGMGPAGQESLRMYQQALLRAC